MNPLPGAPTVTKAGGNAQHAAEVHPIPVRNDGKILLRGLIAES